MDNLCALLGFIGAFCGALWIICGALWVAECIAEFFSKEADQ